jgi:multimeric flavodoxin WrbA
MQSQKIVILKGSPREAGNSAILAEQVAAGAEAAGAEVESFYLHGMDIQACDACDTCQGESEIDCTIEDDMQTLYPKLRRADALVYASPIYWFTVSAQIKLFMDRCYGLQGDTDKQEDNALAGKRIGIVLTYGGDDPFDSGAVNAIRTFQDTFNYISSEIVGIVYGYALDAGEIRENPEVMQKAYQLGKDLASNAAER